MANQWNPLIPYVWKFLLVELLNISYVMPFLWLLQKQEKEENYAEEERS